MTEGLQDIQELKQSGLELVLSDPFGAYQLFQKIPHDNPAHAECMAYLFLRAKSYEQAGSYAKQVLNRDSSSVPAKMYLGDIALANGHAREAKQFFESAQGGGNGVREIIASRVDFSEKEIQYYREVRNAQTISIVLGLLSLLVLVACAMVIPRKFAK